MGVGRRMMVASGVTVSAAAITLLWVRVGLPLIDRAQTQSGPFTQVADQVSTLFPLVLAVLVLAIWVWVIAGGVQKQVDERRRVRR